jgi:hypothetical protein
MNLFLRTLADEEADSNAGHVETIEPCLDIETDVASILTPLPLQYTLRNCCHGRVVPLLDRFESLRKAIIVVLYLGRPGNSGCLSIIPERWSRKYRIGSTGYQGSEKCQ